MLFLYNFGVRLYALLVLLASPFNAKAKRWVNGRRQQKVTGTPKGCIWFHFASLGEFEQGRPVLEQLRLKYPGKKFAITFFSPSGYEIRKNTPLADAVYYLPLDTAAHARKFVAELQPQLAVFTKYEYWYHFFDELHRQHIPLFIISGIFRPGQIFFRWYGGLHRRMLGFVNQLFVQDEHSRQLLLQIGVTHVQVSGDTRFDRVWANALHPKTLSLIEAFKNSSPIFIGGSTWPADEELIAGLINRYPNWKFMLAPHEVEEKKIEQVCSLLPAGITIRLSALTETAVHTHQYRVLVIDNIGMLSALYQYGDITYIGGGFGVGIHNTLESAAFGQPVIFGPNYQRFREARELIKAGAGFSIRNADELQQVTHLLITEDKRRLQAGANARQYVLEHTGATDMIVNYILNKAI